MRNAVADLVRVDKAVWSQAAHQVLHRLVAAARLPTGATPFVFGHAGSRSVVEARMASNSASDDSIGRPPWSRRAYSTSSNHSGSGQSSASILRIRNAPITSASARWWTTIRGDHSPAVGERSSCSGATQSEPPGPPPAPSRPRRRAAHGLMAAIGPTRPIVATVSITAGTPVHLSRARSSSSAKDRCVGSSKLR